jgi:hypothetical protein
MDFCILNNIERIPVENQPRRLTAMADTADYIVDNEGQLMEFVIPGRLDFEGKYNWTGLYFNLPDKVSHTNHF